MPTGTKDLISPTVRESLYPQPPFLWPDARVLNGMNSYKSGAPSDLGGILETASLVNGVVVGAHAATVRWVESFLKSEAERKLVLVLVLFPAGPTRAEHLRHLMTAVAAADGGPATVELHIFPMQNRFEDNSLHFVLPPSVIQAYNATTQKTVLSVGSVGDMGHDPAYPGSINFVFEPADALRNEWRRWFQYLLEVSKPLSPELCDVPDLTPARGEIEAAQRWASYAALCSRDGRETQTPHVDAETGEVTATADGKPVVPWDADATKLDTLAILFQAVYAKGSLVTVDEMTRLKPIAIPVKAALLDQETQKKIGTVTRHQTFTLHVLDEDVEKNVEKCRKIGDLLDLLSLPLGKGVRWFPETAKPLLVKDLERRNQDGLKLLWEAISGGKIPVPTDKEAVASVDQLIAAKEQEIRTDLGKMYNDLGKGSVVPEGKIRTVLDDVRTRLTKAISAPLAPRVIHNSISAPSLGKGQLSDNWSQPLSLLVESTRLFRESLTDPYFSRKFVGLSFTEAEYLIAMDIFGDPILQTKNKAKANEELDYLDYIIAFDDGDSQKKCQLIWTEILGNPAQ